jgi:hypothetical protein
LALMEKTVVVHADEAFAVVHAMLRAMGHPTGPFARSVMTQTAFECALHELEGIFDLVSHEPAHDVDVDCDTDPVAAIELLEGHLATLIVNGNDLEEILRATRTRDFVRAAAAEWLLNGE